MKGSCHFSPNDTFAPKYRQSSTTISSFSATGKKLTGIFTRPLLRTVLEIESQVRRNGRLPGSDRAAVAAACAYAIIFFETRAPLAFLMRSVTINRSGYGGDQFSRRPRAAVAVSWHSLQVNWPFMVNLVRRKPVRRRERDPFDPRETESSISYSSGDKVDDTVRQSSISISRGGRSRSSSQSRSRSPPRAP